MNAPKRNPDWDSLVERARADVGPAANLSVVLRAVREAGIEPVRGWGLEIAALLHSHRLASVCVAGIAVVAAFGGWQVWSLSETLPWAQFVVSATGGVP